MDKDDIVLMYKVNNVTPEKTELYLDFIHGIFDLVTTTYLGDDVMFEEDIENHFKWCWGKNIDNFKKEKLYFLDDEDLYNYFHTLFIESFYNEDNKTESNINQLLEFWSDIFKYNFTKTMSELEAFLDLYKIFNTTLYV